MSLNDILLRSCPLNSQSDTNFQEYRQKIDSDLATIKEELLMYFGEDAVIAIVLVGGWGRDEKTALCIQGLGTRILSDYDILVLVSQNGPDTRHIGLRERLSQQVGVKVEIGVYTCHSISRLPPSVFAYELSQHKVLWGEIDALDRYLPPVEAAQIPVSEGSRFLFNRGSALLIGLQEFLRDPSSIEARVNLLLNLTKMSLALGDAFLIAEGSYHWSGQKRFELVQDSRMPEDLKQWYGKAWRLKHGLEVVNLNDDVWNLCTTFLRFCSIHHLSFERKRLGDERLSWCRYATRELTIGLLKPWNYIRVARMNLSLFGGPRRPGHPPLGSYIVSLERRMRAVMPLLLYARADDTELEKRIDMACRLLNLPADIQGRDIERQLFAASEKFGYIWRTFLA